MYGRDLLEGPVGMHTNPSRRHVNLLLIDPRLSFIELPPLRSLAALRAVPMESRHIGMMRGLDAAVEAEVHAAAVDRLFKSAGVM